MPTRLVVMLHSRRSARAAVTASGDAPSRQPTSATRVHAFGKPRRGYGGSADEDDAAVIDVGSGRSGSDEVLQTLEEICRIVVLKEGGRIKTEPLRPRKGGFVDDGAGRIGGRAAAAVGAVRIGGEGGDVRGAPQSGGQGEGVFLVGAAAAPAADGHRELSPRDNGRALAQGRHVESEPGMGLGHLARLAF